MQQAHWRQSLGHGSAQCPGQVTAAAVRWQTKDARPLLRNAIAPASHLHKPYLYWAVQCSASRSWLHSYRRSSTSWQALHD